MGPGLAKSRALPLVLGRRKLILRAFDPNWRDLLRSADVVSEGLVREEDQGRVWYGSTSLILDVGERLAPLVAAMASRDMHFRLRALRTAHREAGVRSPGRLGRLVCDMHIVSVGGTVRIDVDVQAPLIEGRRGARGA